MRCPTLLELPPPPPGKTGWPWAAEASQMPDTTPDGNPWPKVSIVTPSFNQGQFIEETIRSVLLQGYPNMEYIIIDGGSTDESVNIIRKYEKWLAYWVSEPDRGQSHAINKGWEIATGDVISWLNSDDYLMSEWARDTVLALLENQKVELVCGDALIVDSQSQPLSVFKGTNPDLEILVMHWLGFPQPGFLMWRRILNQCGFLDEQLHYTMDFEYWVRLLMRGVKVRYISEVLATSRLHPASKTSNLYRVGISNLLEITEKFSKGAPASLENIARRAMKRAYWNAAYLAFVNDDGKLVRRYVLEYLKKSGLAVLPEVLSLYTLSVLGNPGKQVFQLYRTFRNLFCDTPYKTIESAKN
jgi:glycosyltransferase involved in cell wall biosynthesis